jgi:hypothetical protein
MHHYANDAQKKAISESVSTVNYAFELEFALGTGCKKEQTFLPFQYQCVAF